MSEQIIVLMWVANIIIECILWGTIVYITRTFNSLVNGIKVFEDKLDKILSYLKNIFER